MADTIYTVYQGRITASFAQKDATQMKLMLAAINNYKEEQPDE